MARLMYIFLTAIVAVAVLTFAYRAWRQSEAADRLQILGSQGIDEAAYVRIGGIDQWVSIRGEDRSNPVVLIVHGGPGSSLLPISYDAFRGWEKRFTIVQWDQRGSGKTFSRNSGDLAKPTLGRLITDGIDVTEWARAKLQREKITILAHSMGTIVGLEMIRREPALFDAYVGTGQIFDMPANETTGYRELLALVRFNEDTSAEERLLQLGPPPYRTVKSLLSERSVLRSHPPASEANLNSRLIKNLLLYPSYSLRDVANWVRAQQFSMETVLPEMLDYEFDHSRPLAVPFIVIQGEQDIQTPTSLVRSRFNDIRAPQSKLIIIPEGGHSALLAMPDTFFSAFSAALTDVHNQDALHGERR